jgi:hypothetical protein
MTCTSIYRLLSNRSTCNMSPLSPHLEPAGTASEWKLYHWLPHDEDCEGTRTYITMNLPVADLVHFSPRAHWNIRSVFARLLEWAGQRLRS